MGDKGEERNEIMEAIKKTKLCTVRAVGEANGLPMRGEGYELYASFPAYATLMEGLQERIITLTGEALRNAGCRSIVHSSLNDIDEFLEQIVEANDSICERAGILLDMLQKAKRMEEVVVPQQILDAESTAATSQQTLCERQGRYFALLQRLSGRTKKPLASAALSAPLLTANDKPQDVYGIHADNSHAKFIPKLRMKHHALDVDDNDVDKSASWPNDQETSLHPYAKELAKFSIPKRQLNRGCIEPLKPLSETELVYIDTLEELENLRDTLNKTEEFAVDLEHNRLRSFLGLTCLMQISTHEKDYIIDPFPLWNDMHILNEPFTDPNILKVFHGADSDIEWLQRDFGIYVVNMFDTYRAMRELCFPRFSYQFLVRQCCCLTLDKKLQKADWRLRPLTEAHILYARSDTHYLLHCYDKLRNWLLNGSCYEGCSDHDGTYMIMNVYQHSTCVCRTVYVKPVFESNGYERICFVKGRFNSRQKFALDALWKWRDERARADDESPDYVLPDHMMLQIAEVLPREMQGILACCSPIPVHVKQELHALHRIINAARDQPLVEHAIFEPVIGQLTFENAIFQLNKMNALKALLRCHLDFSSTKYNEEIRDIVTQKVNVAISEESRTTSTGILSTEVYTIGETVQEENERLTKVLKKLDDWATPYECYRVGLMEQKSKAEDRSKEVEEDGKDSKQNMLDGKKLWSHLDPATRKPGFTKRKIEISELQSESERKETDGGKMCLEEELTFTKKEMNKKRKQESRHISIPITQGTSKSGNEFPAKRGQKCNWTDAAETCDERVDYSTFDPNLFKKNVPVASDVYDPFKQGKRGRWKSRRGRRMRRETKPC